MRVEFPNPDPTISARHVVQVITLIINLINRIYNFFERKKIHI